MLFFKKKNQDDANLRGEFLWLNVRIISPKVVCKNSGGPVWVRGDDCYVRVDALGSARCGVGLAEGSSHVKRKDWVFLRKQFSLWRCPGAGLVNSRCDTEPAGVFALGFTEFPMKVIYELLTAAVFSPWAHTSSSCSVPSVRYLSGRENAPFQCESFKYQE